MSLSDPNRSLRGNAGTLRGVAAFSTMKMSDQMIELDYEEWREGAACLDDTEGIFFPDDGNVGAIRRAKAVCAECPVADECLMYAIETGQSDGIWGGTTPRERRKLKRLWIEEVRRAS